MVPRRRTLGLGDIILGGVKVRCNVQSEKHKVRDRDVQLEDHIVIFTFEMPAG